ncbi:hypothetical protein HanIR_Chr14g0725691 [Helianthus annuus]|nr:hypothetical protein HanIR_Chr14g0725691 [Helianthus annuus]
MLRNRPLTLTQFDSCFGSGFSICWPADASLQISHLARQATLSDSLDKPQNAFILLAFAPTFVFSDSAFIYATFASYDLIKRKPIQTR